MAYIPTISSTRIKDGTITNSDINASAAIAYSKLNLTSSIVNADISASAAIAYSKLNLASSITSGDIVDGTIVNGDINASAAIAYSKLNLTGSIVSGDITDGTIVNGDISASAAIAYSKLALTNEILVADLDDSVTLNAIASDNATSADVSMNTYKLTNLGTPVSATDAATKGYVDGVATGLDVKASVRVVTAAALPAYTRVGNVITADANGALAAVDGVTLVVGNRLLLKDGAAGADNGIYEVTAVGDGSNPFVLTRTSDADSSAEVTGGMFTFATEGTANGDTGWVLTTNDPITLNTTALSFSQFSSATVVSTLDSLTDVDVTGVVDGSLLRYESTGTQWNDTTALLFSDAGQLQVTTTGSGAGIVIGGDAQIYRSAADVLRTPDAMTVDSTFTTGGARFLKVTSIDDTDSPYTVAAGDDVILVDTTAGAVTINLGAVASNSGRRLQIKDVGGNAGTNNITIDPNGAETIDNASTYVLDENLFAIDIVCDGSENYVL